jgi:hypothetical protein
MVTRQAVGVLRPVDCFILSATTSLSISPMSSSVHSVLVNHHWCCAMEEKYRALLANHIWDLVSRSLNGNVVTGKWIWTNKQKADGSLNGTRHVGFSRGLHSALVLTTMRRSVPP